jgi:hypothetical protein
MWMILYFLFINGHVEAEIGYKYDSLFRCEQILDELRSDPRFIIGRCEEMPEAV